MQVLTPPPPLTSASVLKPLSLPRGQPVTVFIFSCVITRVPSCPTRGCMVLFLCLSFVLLPRRKNKRCCLSTMYLVCGIPVEDSLTEGIQQKKAEFQRLSEGHKLSKKTAAFTHLSRGVSQTFPKHTRLDPRTQKNRNFST